MTEIWKPIPGLDGYEASNVGRIRSLARIVPSRGGKRKLPTRIVTPYLVKSTGYRQVKVRGKKHLAHRLIASTWCPGFFEGAWVDHINGLRDDNRPENLEWVTPSENAKRAFRNGRARSFKGSFSSSHPTSKAVVSTSLLDATTVVWPSAMDAVREGFDGGSISRCCRGLSRTHKGFLWAFLGDEVGIEWSEEAKT